MSLKLEISLTDAPGPGPASVRDLAKLKIKTLVTNIGTAPITLITDPSSILSKQAFAEKFTIFSSSDRGKRPTYRGILAKISQERAISLNFVQDLEPGQSSLAVVHDLSTLYDFTACGQGEYTFVPSATLNAIDQLTKEIYVITPVSIPSLNVLIMAEKLALEREEPKVKEPVTDYKRQIQLTAAIQAAEDYANEAASYLENISGATLRFETWFGKYDEQRKKKVKAHFDEVRNALPFAKFTIGGEACDDWCGGTNTVCKCTEKTCKGCGCKSLFAYVHADETDFTIHLAKLFWDAPVTGSDSKAGTIIHELSHFNVNGQTVDAGYGTSGCKDLAVAKANVATSNADSHQYFSENNPFLD